MAKKRYYESKKDRMDESEGMKRYYRDKRMLGGEQKSYDDNGMLYEDRNAIANMPQDVKYYQYRSPYAGRFPDNMGDTLPEVDMQISDDVNGMVRHMKPEKY